MDKNTKFSWLAEEVKSEDTIRHELLGIVFISFLIAIVIVVTGFLLLT